MMFLLVFLLSLGSRDSLPYDPIGLQIAFKYRVIYLLIFNEWEISVKEQFIC